jgi:16S rRNA (cytosine967-C5)-methyltransferase
VRTDLLDTCVLEVLGLVREQGWLADRSLERVLRRERRLYASERRAVAETVYGILRSLGQLEWLLANETAPAPAVLLALWLARTGAAPPEVAARRLGVPPRAIMAALDRPAERIAAIPDPVERLAVEASLPPWIVERFVAELGLAEAGALARAMNERAPLTVRANLLKTRRDALQSRLTGEGTSARLTRFSPWGLVLDGHANAFALPSFQEGLFEIQDEGSQLVALAVGARPGWKVADACAGAGGKALALSAEMHGKGSLIALDSDADRLAEAQRRARRAGVHNLRARPIPAGQEAIADLADLAGQCERVLVDAPCAGLGTLRRKPDARWRLKPDDPARFAALQKELLVRFAALVKPGGRLVYATCSIGRAENADVAAFVVREVAGLAPFPLSVALGEDLARTLGADGHMLQLLPHRHGTDGFFVAAFTRTG